MTNHELVLKLFLQITVILAACRVVGLIGRRLGQTQVVSEMVAGVILGPSLFGLLAPGIQSWLFPKTMLVAVGDVATTIPHPSMSILYALSQVGLVLFMFLVGLEFNSELIMGRLRSAGIISGAGIAIPFILGASAAIFMRDRADLFGANVSFWVAPLYFGAAMAITAFPVLARILYESGLAKTRVGTLALAAGSVDDAIAWCMLAGVLAIHRGSGWILVLAVGGGLTYVLGVIFIGRPLLARFDSAFAVHDRITSKMLVNVLLILILAAWLTDAIRLYAVFGAFILGTAMPRGRFAEQLRGKLEGVTSTLLVPIFFVYSGLNTQIGLLNTVPLLLLALVVFLLAILGKGLACMLAARLAGETWRESATIGALMNARGLMELIILNIGLQEGIITPTCFTIMVMMALVTTLMASPLFHLLYGRRAGEMPYEAIAERSSA